VDSDDAGSSFRKSGRSGVGVMMLSWLRSRRPIRSAKKSTENTAMNVSERRVSNHGKSWGWKLFIVGEGRGWKLFIWGGGWKLFSFTVVCECSFERRGEECT
jgi:hypothetical protein